MDNIKFETLNFGDVELPKSLTSRNYGNHLERLP